MSDDHLDKDVSVNAELTPSGLNVKAKSRFVAAVDRLCGNAVEYLNVPMERRHVVERAKIEGEKQLIEAMTKAAVDRIGKDPEFAERAIRNHLGLSIDRQENKDGVVRHAIEDLNRNSVAEETSSTLDKGFLNKFERHAEDAATDELREKWGRVLSAEIRKPGTVTSRVMRIVDEIDPETAQLFEDFCRSRLADVVPTCLAGELNLRTVSKLVGSGLIIDPGFTGHVRQFQTLKDSTGRDLWFTDLGRKGLALPHDAVINAHSKRTLPIDKKGDAPVIPAYVITDEGFALASILADLEQQAFDLFLISVRKIYPMLPMTIYEKNQGGHWKPISEVPVASDGGPVSDDAPQRTI